MELTFEELVLLYNYLKYEWVSYENLPLRALVTRIGLELESKPLIKDYELEVLSDK